jgi:hypothetical protein
MPKQPIKVRASRAAPIAENRNAPKLKFFYPAITMLEIRCSNGTGLGGIVCPDYVVRNSE